MWHVFFFKQKTAYEMRISDWSSDVCSSDLASSPDSDTSLWRVPAVWITSVASRKCRSSGPRRMSRCCTREPGTRVSDCHSRPRRRPKPSSSRSQRVWRYRRRSDERRVGKEWVRTGRTRCGQYHSKNNEEDKTGEKK